jgi:hypothetical protein
MNAKESVRSAAWAHLVGQPTPATPWGRQGDAWPVKYVDTAVVAGGDVAVQDSVGGPPGRAPHQRAPIGSRCAHPPQDDARSPSARPEVGSTNALNC